MCVDDTQSESEAATASGSDDGAERSLNRRSVLLSTAGASASILAGCSGGNGTSGNSSGGSTTTGSSSSSEGSTLRVADWSGQYHTYFKNTIKPLYENETGTTIELVPGWSAILSKIKSAPADDPPYDIAVTEGQMYKQARGEELFLEIREENVPNLKKVYPYLKDFRSTEYAIPFDGAPVAAMYNNEQVDYEISDWRTLVDRNARLTMDGGFYAYTLHIAAIVADQLDNVGEMYDREYHQTALETADEFNVTSYYGSGAERWQQMQLHVAAVAQSYFGVSVGRKNDNDWISVDLPLPTTGYYDHYGIVRGTDNRREAERFLNFMLRTDVQAKWGETSHQLLANKEAEHSDLALEAGFPTSNSEYKKFHFPDYEYLEQFSSKFSTEFQKLKQS